MNEEISALLGKFRKYGLKESTIDSLNGFIDDVVERIIVLKNIRNDNYPEIAGIMAKYNKLFLRSIDEGIRVYIDKNLPFSDYEIIEMGEKLREATIKYINEINNITLYDDKDN